MKKFLLTFLASLILLFSFAPYFAVNAQTPAPSQTSSWYNQGFGDWFLKVNDQSNPSEIFGERYTAAQVTWVIYGVWSFMLNFVLGPKMGAVAACVLSAPSQQQQLGTCLQPAFSGLVSYVPQHTNSSLLSLVFADRPLSGVSYIRHRVQNFSLVPVANAQTVGFGFSALETIQDIWASFRDIAYGLFVVATIIFAFMIMFRVKINPQTVITVQSAIPKIIIALVLVTFSYAISGLLIDLMYVVIGLISLVMAGVIPTAPLLQPSTFTPADVFNILTVGPVTQSTVQGAGSTAGGILGILGLYMGPLAIIIVAGMLVVAVASILGAPTGIVTVAGAVVIILLIVMLVVLLWMAVKVIWSLFKAFANVILYTVFAPLYLSLGILIPNFGFGQWVKNYLSHLSVFVVTGVLSLFAWIFSLIAWNYFWSGGSAPDLTNIASGASANPWPPLLGSFVGGGDFGISVVFAGVAFVFFTMIPKSAELVQSFISGKPFSYGAAVGEALAGVGALYGASGAKDIVELARSARRLRMLDQFIGQGGPLAGIAQRFVGGPSDKAKGVLEGALEKGHGVIKK